MLKEILEARKPFSGSMRLCNGFLEGMPALTIDLFGRTLVLHDYSETGDEKMAREALATAQEVIGNLKACVHKIRKSEDPGARRGSLLLGTERDLDRNVKENEVRYALDLLAWPDGGFYLDTRDLRAWAKANLADKKVLNTFAHTCSLGIAALAGGATMVVHTDKNKAALDLGKQSYALNSWPVSRADFIAGDFFPVVARLRKESALFDCVFVDPPFFSQTQGGRVDLGAMRRLVDKARPLVGDGGKLVLVNNALWVSGKDYDAMLAEACSDGYMEIETRISVPRDVRGFLPKGSPPTDPAPYDHSTKIAVLSVKRKDGKKA